MYSYSVLGVRTKSQTYAQGTRKRRGCKRWPLRLESLEDHMMLSGGPTIYTVTDTSNLITDTGSLVFAINEANANPNPAGSLIEFSTPQFRTPQTITLTSTLTLTGSAGPITVVGPGAGLLTVSGGNAVRVFGIGPAVTAVVSGLTIVGGSATNGAGFANRGTVTLSNSSITDNTSSGNDGEGGGIFNDGVMTISGCTIANNMVSGNHGLGGGVFNDGQMTLANSTVDHNSTTGSDGLGGGIFNESTLLVSHSTISFNKAAGGKGGGIFNGATLTIPDSTIAHNSAESLGGGIYTQGKLTAVNTTIAYNSVLDAGGGLYVFGAPNAILENSIVALNSVGVAPDDIGGTVSAGSSFNLIGIGGDGGLISTVNGNQVNVANPGLGPLADNGASTATIALLPGSPAIDKGSNALDGLATDQRGPGWMRIANGTIDIGAFEVQPATVTAVSVNWGRAGAAVLQTAADGLRLLPAGRNADLPWSGINKLQISFNQPETLTAADVTIMSARGINFGPVTITGSGATFTITLSRPVTNADRVTIKIAGAGIAAYTRRLDVLPGDFDDNAVVNKADAKSLRNELTGVTKATVFGDVSGDQKVDAIDLKVVKKFVGKTLPKIRNMTMVARERALRARDMPCSTTTSIARRTSLSSKNPDFHGIAP